MQLVSKNAHTPATVSLPLVRRGIYEVVLLLEDPAPGTGIFLGDDAGRTQDGELLAEGLEQVAGVALSQEVGANADAMNERLVFPLGARDDRDRVAVDRCHHAAARPYGEFANLPLETGYGQLWLLGKVNRITRVQRIGQ